MQRENILAAPSTNQEFSAILPFYRQIISWKSLIKKSDSFRFFYKKLRDRLGLIVFFIFTSGLLYETVRF